MKKWTTMLATALLTVTMAFSTFAAPSKQVDGNVSIDKVINTETGEDVEGADVKPLDEVPEFQDQKSDIENIKDAEEMKEVLDSLGIDSEDMHLVDQVVVVYPDVPGLPPLQYYLEVQGVKDDTVVYVLAWDPETETWKKIEAVVRDGKVIVTLDKTTVLSIIVKGVINASGVSPTTGEHVNRLPDAIAGIALCGMAVSACMIIRKRRVC